MRWRQAREAAYAAAAPIPPCAVPVAEALGSVLTKPLTALTSLPSFDRSAMDGYAVCGAGPWTIRGRQLAGQPAPSPLTSGQAYEIATGAAVPAGCFAVLPYEYARVAGTSVSGPVSAGEHIRRAGEECRRGEELLAAGTVVSAQVQGLAAAVGHDQLWVRPMPRIGAVITGDEVRTRGLPEDGCVRDAIGPLLPGFVAWSGGTLIETEFAADTEKDLIRALDSSPGELLLVSGSSSVGPADLLRRVLHGLGGTMLVERVDCRPGHPQSLARLGDGRLLVGLPGNPLAAVVAYLTLAVPVCAAMRGLPLPALETVAAPDLAAHPSRTRLVPVQVRDGVARGVAHGGSAMLRGLALADALAVVEPDGEVVLLPLP
ncbi:molybdopterin molybdotransferase MoeA [Fodinicola acaciae]|uniref:molybdopterin molybdotransferase MoeA n=1 Tax=Fodinicola acaciae TaxID=2681555 RepID=UPI0013D0969A|nr:molybdopterin molybdotransferase MoeA [Fodinicola acaciae]